MVKRFFGLLLLISVFISNISAEQVSKSEAAEIARIWYLNYCPDNSKDVVISGNYENYKNGLKTFYVFTFLGGGFVLVAADNASVPILGYSFNSDIDQKNSSPAFKEWIDNYEKMLVDIQSNERENAATIDMWNQIRNKNFDKSQGKDVAPLINTQWNQSWPYNSQCPENNNGPGGHVLVGCVATAMAQVMKFHDYPEHGTSSHSYHHASYGYLSADFGETYYDWENMPVYLNNNSSQVTIDAVAELCSHCGISVNMNYGANSSGANSGMVKNSLVNYFNYSGDIQYKGKTTFHESDWEELLMIELDELRPMYYDGHGSGGHAFVCDGYMETGSNRYFHFNWGWGGYSDGYFYINNLNPGGSNFTNDQHAIIYIEPADSNANFSAESCIGLGMLEVNFIDTSPVSAISWDWDFGDGSSSTEQNPQHIYTEIGNYTVSLTINTGNKEFVKSKLNFIQVKATDEMEGLIDSDRILYDDIVRVKGDVIVKKGVNLTINPGVIIELQGNYHFIVNGKLTVNGTEAEPVIFTINDTTGFSNPNIETGGWKGILFNGTQHESEISKLEFCKIEYVKNFIGILAVNYTDLKLSNVEISECFGQGMLSSSSNTEIKNSVFRNIRSLPVSSSTSADELATAFNSFHSSPKITNVMIVDNQFNENGLCKFVNSSPEILNVTITDNILMSDSGSIVVSDDNSEMTIKNSILWNENVNELNILNNSTTEISFSDIQGGQSSVKRDQSSLLIYCPSNLNVLPGFEAASYTLKPWSSCINRGSPSEVNYDSLDLGGNPRIFSNSNIDIGAFEYQDEKITYNLGFQGNILEGFSFLDVQFNDTSEVGFDKIYWDFNYDGIMDTNNPEAHWFFETPGEFSVTAIYSIGEMQIEIPKFNYIRVLNKAPEIVMAIDELCFFEDLADSSLNLDSLFTDPEGQNLIYDYSGGEHLTVSIKNSKLFLKPEPNWFGREDIILSATDIDSGTTSDTILVKVLAVNDAPIITELFPDSIGFYSGYSDTLLIDGMATDIDNPDSSLVWKIVKNNFVNCTISPEDNYIVFMAEDGECGVDTLVLTVSDSSLTAQDTIIVYVKQVVGLGNEQNNLPQKFILHQNYPNPFNPGTTICFDIPQITEVKIDVFDLLGNHVISLINEKREAGRYTLYWNGKSGRGGLMSAGVYIYRLSANDYVDYKKMLLIK